MYASFITVSEWSESKSIILFTGALEMLELNFIVEMFTFWIIMTTTVKIITLMNRVINVTARAVPYFSRGIANRSDQWTHVWFYIHVT